MTITRNPEGLTWPEWFAATLGKKASDISPSTMREMRTEWRNGVDPCEWAYLLSTGQKG